MENKSAGFKNGEKTTEHCLSYHYNIRYNYVLGICYVYVKRIPCCYNKLLMKLSYTWDTNKYASQHKRYMGYNLKCIYWTILVSYNNYWMIFCTYSSNENIKKQLKMLMLSSRK